MNREDVEKLRKEITRLERLQKKHASKKDTCRAERFGAILALSWMLEENMLIRLTHNTSGREQ